MGAKAMAIVSGRVMPIVFGTSSPRTRVKKVVTTIVTGYDTDGSHGNLNSWQEPVRIFSKIVCNSGPPIALLRQLFQPDFAR